MSRHLSDQLWLRLSMIYIPLCSETLVSDMPYAFISVLLAAYVRDGYGAFWQPNVSLAVAKCWYLVFVVRDRLYVFKSLPPFLSESNGLIIGVG